MINLWKTILHQQTTLPISMTSYLICWKPSKENPDKGWPEENLVMLSKKIKDEGPVIEPWRFKQKKNLKVGERVFLGRQGRKGYAILGFGQIHELPDTNGYVPVIFHQLVNPQEKYVLASAAELQAIKPGKEPWGSQSSGIKLPPEVALALENLVIGRNPIVETKVSNPDWAIDELILALDLYFRVPESRGISSHPECIKLSEVLNGLPFHNSIAHGATFRNPNGVAMKLSNFLKYDPGYAGKGLSAGSRLEKEVWDTYAPNLDKLRETAEAIMSFATKPEESVELFSNSAEDDEEFEAPEGRILSSIHRRRERQPGLTKRKKEQVMRATGSLRCEVCSFDFKEKYGDRGDGFAECHHSQPVSEMRVGQKTKLSDLHIVCANCHRMIHKKRPWLSLEEMKKIISGGVV